MAALLYWEGKKPRHTRLLRNTNPFSSTSRQASGGQTAIVVTRDFRMDSPSSGGSEEGPSAGAFQLLEDRRENERIEVDRASQESRVARKAAQGKSYGDGDSSPTQILTEEAGGSGGTFRPIPHHRAQ